jgi:soluble lytic murein transglycosylase-like protein
MAPQFNPLVSAPDASAFSPTAVAFGQTIGNLPDVFRQSQIDQSRIAAMNAVKGLGPNATIQDVFAALAKSGDVADIVKLMPDLQAGQASDAVKRLLDPSGAGATAAPTPGATAAPTSGATAAPPEPPRAVAGNTLTEMVSSSVAGPPDTQQTVATNIGRALGLAASDPIPADKRANAIALVQSYAKSVGRPAPTQNALAFASAADKYGPQFGVDADLLKRQGFQESGFNPSSTSPKGAAGVSQFMPETARRFGVDVRDVDSSVRGQAEYMRFLMNRYGGNEGLALAGYNWGEGNVDKWLAGGRGPPPETVNYVQSISGKSLGNWRRDYATGGDTQTARSDVPPAQAQARRERPREDAGPPVSAAAGQRITPPPSAAAVTPAAPVAPGATGGYTVGWGGPDAAAARPPPTGPVPPAAATIARAGAVPAAATPLAATPVPTVPVPAAGAPTAALPVALPGHAPPSPTAPTAPAPTPAAPPPAAPPAPAQRTAAEAYPSGYAPRPLVTPESLPQGFAPDQWRQAADRLDAAAGTPNLSAQQALALRHKAERIRAAHDPMQIGGNIFDPASGEVIYEHPVNVGGELRGSVTGRHMGGTNELSDEALKNAAEYYLQSGKFTAAARDREGRTLIQNEAARMASERGIAAQDLPRRWQIFASQPAAFKVLETRAVNLDLAENEAKRLIPRVREISDRISRTNYPTLNSLILAAEKGTGGEDVIRLGTAIASLKPVYARILKPQGQITVDDQKRSDDILEKAWSGGQIRAALDQMGIELNSAKRGLFDTMGDMGATPGMFGIQMRPPEDRTGGGAGAGAGATTAPPSAGAGSPAQRWERGPDGKPRLVQ